MQSTKISITTSILTTCNLPKLAKMNLYKLTLSFKMINTTYLWFCDNDLLDFRQCGIGGDWRKFGKVLGVLNL